jgi:hypothetical protein
VILVKSAENANWRIFDQVDNTIDLNDLLNLSVEESLEDCLVRDYADDSEIVEMHYIHHIFHKGKLNITDSFKLKRKPASDIHFLSFQVRDLVRRHKLKFL